MAIDIRYTTPVNKGLGRYILNGITERLLLPIVGSPNLLVTEITGEITPATVTKINRDLSQLINNETLLIVLDSEGGDPDAAERIGFNLMPLTELDRVAILGAGSVKSAAFSIFRSIPVARTGALSSTVFMAHFITVAVARKTWTIDPEKLTLNGDFKAEFLADQNCFFDAWIQRAKADVAYWAPLARAMGFRDVNKFLRHNIQIPALQLHQLGFLGHVITARRNFEKIKTPKPT